MFKYFLRNIFIILIYSWFYIPIIIIIINSFNLSNFGTQWQGFSFKWYYYIINNNFLLEATYHSLIIAIMSATFATIMGFFTAITIYYSNIYIKSFISILLFIVIVSPDIIMAISLLLLFILLNFTLGFWTLLFSHITFCIPYVVITIHSRLKNFDNRILEAAKDLGASDYIIITKIILPLMLPAIISSWLLSFALSMDDITISTFVTGPTYEILPLKIFSMVKIGVSPEINALATILIIISLLLFLISRIILKKFYKNYYPINYFKSFK
ncbi:spermidine/putrescine ABC transporter permease PotC [Enterobacteriaceae endosymbiont of Plateumaris consimilis]|uniref:spermidine/putrescine ABC transporter permease PotC n=1 Tax=Enterobacteriaceae endosymbiont of Plateumaris consimilis TaxID=2675794 RepID=UPI001448D523|nr:spermidine/putrescine ABC transporter permease PotC [Enterobacteriaceae endosymbiont of Plateumaris consimilis]QJC28827.1 spermidine/putrescine ABC transporter permease PotC [Enterobacteriaceae endosymbiont of Plateumaris consimilis]